MKIEVNGHIVEVDDNFANLPEDEQHSQIDEIASTLGPKAEATTEAPKSQASLVPNIVGGAEAALISKGIGLPKAVLGAAKNYFTGTPAAAPEPSELSGTERWFKSANEINEKAKIIRRNTALANRYPQFERKIMEETIPLIKRVDQLSKTIPGKAFVSGANITDVVKHAGEDELGNVQAGMSAVAAAAPWLEKRLPGRLGLAAKALSYGAPVINYGIDVLRGPKEEKAMGGLAHMAEGHSAKSKIHKFAKSIPMPQTANLALNLGLGLGDIEEEHGALQSNLQQGKYGSALNNLINIGSTVSPYFLVPAIYQGGRDLAESAAGQLAYDPAQRSQMQAMSSSPLGGALSGDAGLASQILGQHEYGEAPGAYGHLLRESRLAKYAPGGSILKKFSEIITPHEGKTLLATMADRTKATEGFYGGPGFINLHPDYTWAVDAPGVATKHLSAVERFGGPKQTVFAPMLMSAEAHKSNRPVFEQIYGDLQKKIKSGEFTPEQIKKLNARILAEKGVDLSKSPGVESPDFLEFANAFHRRGKVADILGLKKVGGVDLEKHLSETIDPALVEAKTGAIGPQLFTIESTKFDPSVHPGYTQMLLGEKGADQFAPVPRQFLFRDLEKQAMEQMGRPMTDYNYRHILKEHGALPNQLIDEKLIRSLQDAGLKKGGKVKKKK